MLGRHCHKEGATWWKSLEVFQSHRRGWYFHWAVCYSSHCKCTELDWLVWVTDAVYCSFHTWYGFHKGKADAQQLERKVETCDQAWVSPSSRELTCNFGLFLRDLQELLKRPEGFYVQVRIFSVSCSMAEKKKPWKTAMNLSVTRLLQCTSMFIY